jgi:hypothetical protein
MKKLYLVLLVFLFAVSCSQAQNANNEQKFIGSWNDMAGSINWDFNNNGRLKPWGLSTKDKIVEYIVTDKKLLIRDRTPNRVYYIIVFDYSFSADGKNLILEYSSGQSFDAVDGKTYWLTKN